MRFEAIHPLRTYRKVRGITLAELAEDVKISRGQLSRIERDQVYPSSQLVRRLVERTGLRADDFMLRPTRAEQMAAGQD